MPLTQNSFCHFFRSRRRVFNITAAAIFFSLIFMVTKYLSEYNPIRVYEAQYVRQAFDGELNNTAINMTDLTSCYKHRANFSSNYFFDRRQPGSVQLREEASSSPLLLGKEKAYFIETSGKLSLSWRQACALESFARYNKHVEVALLLVDPDNYRTGTPKTDRSFLIKLLTCNYGNINVIYQTAEELVKETVLQEWYHQSNWKSSPYKTAHLSDGIRLLVLFTLGGYYFDLDIIHIRPIENLRNFFTLQDRYQVCNAALHSEKEHPIIEQSLRDFVQNYKSDVWDENGPVLLTKILKRWCKKDLKENENHIDCRGFRAYAPSLFYPVDFEELELLFTDVTGNYSFTDQVVGVHTWNKLSYNRPVYKHSNQLYSLLARENCPVTFHNSPGLF